MSRATWRALRSELLRGVAPVAAIATLAGAAGMLYSDRITWAGQWMQLAASLRDSMYVLGALAIAAGAWQVGRDVRRRSTEQLEATPRRRLQSVTVAWAAVTLGCWLGMLIAVVAGAVLVARVATYSGGGWWWLIVVAFVVLAAMSALGVMLGRLLPYRLTGPIAAIVVYGLLILAHDEARALGEARWLAPFVLSYESVGRTLSVEVHLQQALWFGGLAAVLLVLAAARSRVYALVPAAVMTTGAVLLISGPAYAQEFSPPTKWRPDPEARELVCTADELVCMPRVEAFLLDDVEPFAREVLARFEGVPGGPTRAVRDYETGSPDDALSLDVWPTITGDLEPDDPSRVVRWSPGDNCRAEASDRQRSRVLDLASSWAVQSPWGDAESEGAWQALRALPEVDQKDWISEVIAAAEACDDEAFAGLWARVS